MTATHDTPAPLTDEEVREMAGLQPFTARWNVLVEREIFWGRVRATPLEFDGLKARVTRHD